MKSSFTVFLQRRSLDHQLDGATLGNEELKGLSLRALSDIVLAAIINLTSK